MDTVVDQVAQLQSVIQQQHDTIVMMMGIIVLFLIINAILAVLLFRSAPPGTLKSIFENFGKPVLAEVTHEAVEGFKTEASLTLDNNWDDLAANIAEKLQGKIFPQGAPSTTTVNVTTTPATDAPSQPPAVVNPTPTPGP